jgi:hypothetical protein
MLAHKVRGPNGYPLAVVQDGRLEGASVLLETVNGSVWEIVTSLATVAAAGGAFIAFLVAIRALQLSRESQRHQLFYTYFREYRTLEMGKAVQELWTFYRVECCNSRRCLIEKYIELHNRGSRFHLHTRRLVSAFYQEIALLVQDSPGMRVTVYEAWKQGDLSIIDKILLPIETIAIPVARGDKEMPECLKITRRSLPTVMKAMYDLWRRAPK